MEIQLIAELPDLIHLSLWPGTMFRLLPENLDEDEPLEQVFDEPMKERDALKISSFCFPVQNFVDVIGNVIDLVD
jgi:hypothetical protein